jgi:hypothetical protein
MAYLGWKVLVLFWLIRLRNGLVDTLSGKGNEEFFMFSFCKSFCKKALLVLVFWLVTVDECSRLLWLWLWLVINLLRTVMTLVSSAFDQVDH